MHPNVLVSSGGRRAGLIRLFRDALRRKRPGAWVGAADCGLSAPARFVADMFWQAPPCRSAEFPGAVLAFCRANDIGLIVPTIDTELPVYAGARAAFEKEGVTICVSAPETIDIARDKITTHEWLLENGFPTVRQCSPAKALSEIAKWRMPLIAKPRDGSASVGVHRVANIVELRHLAETKPGYILQELALGREFTVNLYVNRSGKCICAVPHWRMEVRAGEVSKGVTVKDRTLMDLGQRVAETLPGARGALNMQCFADEQGVISIIEINARFGGGYPLAHEAGARFTDWLLDEQEGRTPVPFDSWTDDLAMLRYDQPLFVSGKSLLPG